MRQQPLTLEPFYKGWDTFQGYFTTFLAPLSEEQLRVRVAPHLRTAGEIAAHIVGTRAGWFSYVMGVGQDVLPQFEDWGDEGVAVPSASELVRGFETTWQVIDECLRTWTPDNLNDVLTAERGGKTYHFARQWVLYHVLEHDLHHGGELFLTMGAHGLATPDV